MKKIFIFLKSLSYMGAAAQEIAKEFKTTTYNSCEVIAADNQYIYLGYGITELFNILPKAQYLYRLDFNLQMVDSVNLTKGLSLDTNERLHLKDIEVDTNGNIYALCFIHEQNAPTQCNGRKSLLLKLGPSFQPLDTIYFESDSLDITLVDMAIKKNTAVLTGSAFICNQILRPYVAKINLNTSSVWSKFYDSLTYNTTLQFIDPAFFADKIILHAVRGIGPSQSGLSTVVLNANNLAILHTGSIMDSSKSVVGAITGSGAFIPVSTDTIWKLSAIRYFLGSPPPGQGFYYYSFGAALLDSTYNVAFVDTFPSSGYDHVTSYQKYGGLFASNDPYDYITADSVLYVQAGKFIQYDNYGSKDSTAMYLYNFNARKGRMNWMRKVPRNFPNGSHAVAALPGNRWAVSFTEYNWQKYPGQNLAVHVWVLNGNGDIISKEEFESPVRKLAVYPNPVNERLYLRKAPSLQGAVSFKIFGINGNMVDSGTIDSGERFIEVGDLSHGSYTLFLQGSRMEGVAKFQKM